MDKKGLTKLEVEELTNEGKINNIKNKTNKTILEIISSNLFTYFNLIFAILAMLLILVGAFKNLLFLPVVIANVLIGIFQQIKAKRILDELALLDIAEYTVIREDKKEHILSTELVLGDLVILKSGSQIPADALVLEGEANVNEALLTGEADDVLKEKGSILKSGSFVTSGEILVRLTHVGNDSYVSKLTKEAKEIKEKKTEMINDIEKIIRAAGILIIPIGMALLYQSIFINGLELKDGVSSMVAAIVGMIPEGLYLLVTVALAISAGKLAKRKVLLHDMRSIESLARVDVLCVDKTGTITSNVMHVSDIFSSNNESKKELDRAKDILSKYVMTIPDNNATIDALREYFNMNEKLEVEEITPFNSKRKYSSIKTKEALYKLGAPEYLLGEEELNNNKNIEEYTKKGKRVLVFTEEKDKKINPILFIVIENELRDNATETFNYLQKQGITIKVISGDNPVTVSKIAQSVNIKDAFKYIDASSLDTDDKIKEAVKNYTVFGRVKPEQKKKIIEAIKKNKLKVAMTGDGINDILAMKEADCSIAMGEGSDAARGAAQVVLLDNDFSHMKNIIAEGRKNINNITRSATLFLYKNIFSLLLSLFSIITVFSYPLKPTQVSMISFFNIGLPAFLLTFEPNYKKQKGRFIKNVLNNAIPASVISFFTIIIMFQVGEILNIPSNEISTAAIYLLSVAGFNLLWFITRPMNKYQTTILTTCVLGILLASRVFATIFDMRDISLNSTILCLFFAMVEMLIIIKLTERIDKINKKKI